MFDEMKTSEKMFFWVVFIDCLFSISLVISWLVISGERHDQSSLGMFFDWFYVSLEAFLTLSVIAVAIALCMPRESKLFFLGVALNLLTIFK